MLASLSGKRGKAKAKAGKKKGKAAAASPGSPTVRACELGFGFLVSAERGAAVTVEARFPSLERRFTGA